MDSDSVPPFLVTSWASSSGAKQSAAVLPLYIFVTDINRAAVCVCVCHLWLLVMTMLSGCPLGSSLSLPFILSWRARRLLSRAASSSSSSFLASLWETERERERDGNFEDTKLQPLTSPSPPFPLSQFSFPTGSFQANDSTKLDRNHGDGQTWWSFSSSLSSSLPSSCPLCNNHYFLSWLIKAQSSAEDDMETEKRCFWATCTGPVGVYAMQNEH